MLKTLLALSLGQAFAVPEGGGAAETLLDLNDVLNTSIDGVEDAPEFVTPPDGSYRLTVNDAKAEDYKTTDKETQEELKKTRLKIFYSTVKTKELSNPEEQPVADGSLFSESFMTNAQGLSYFKRQAKNILGEDAIKGATIGDILKELCQGHQFDADVRVKVSQGKGQDGAKRTFSNVQVRIKPGTGQDPAL